MANLIALIGNDVFIDMDGEDAYTIMLNAITDRVFQLLGPEFDKSAYLEEVESGKQPEEIGQGWAVPVALILALELGFCLGQLRNQGHPMDCDRALKDLYALWKTRLRTMLANEKPPDHLLH